MSRIRTRVPIVCAGLLAAAAVLPAPALAHGLVGKQDLPIPRWLFAWAAAIVLVVSFVALGTLWVKARWEAGYPERPLFTLPAPAEPICGAIGIALFGISIYAGLAGSKEALDNALPTVIYVLFWVGIPFASVLFGDFFRFFNPWLAVGRGTGWLVRRFGGDSVPEPLPYPDRLGRWPVVVGIFCFAWLELVYTDKDDPRKLALLAILYALVQLVAMSLYGADRWSQRGDAFSVYFNLFSRLSPLRWKDRTLELQPPLAGVTGLTPVAGTVTLLCVMIGSTSFDGFSQGKIWNGAGGTGLSGRIDDFFHNTLGMGLEPALEASFTVGLLLMIGVIAGVYRLGVVGMSTVGTAMPPAELAKRFIHTLVPIALAYIVAHYFSLLAYQGQAVAYLVSDPLGNGSDIFGTATASINYNVISATQVWYVQVAALVTGHVCGLILAHDRALGSFSDVKVAVRSQYWMLTVMVGFTSLGLFLLSDAT